MIKINNTNFQSEVLDKSGEVPVLVDFWASWCGPCNMIAPVLEKLEAEYAGKFVLAKASVDENQDLAAKYSVMSIPSVKLFKNGVVVDEFVGALPENRIKEFIDKNL